MTPVERYQRKKDRLVADYRSGGITFRLAKNSMTNLFRYGGNASRARQGLRVDDFNRVLEVDVERNIIDVEGMTTIEKVVETTLAYGLLPPVSPELKHITIGGAIVGIGIESSCYLHGFFHDSVIAAEVLLPTGDVVVCSPDNEFSDLFHALPNSFGTLGYVLRATLRLMPAKKNIVLNNHRFERIDDYLAAFERYVADPAGMFLEGMFYNDREFYLASGTFADSVNDPISIYRGVPYYKKTRRPGRFELTTVDYIFRFDPDWFWNVPDKGAYEIFRQWGPIRLRNSSFYTRFTGVKRRIRKAIGMINENEEELIQDWVVPWNRAGEFIEFIVDNIDIRGQPWVALPIVPRSTATLYPLKSGDLYLNIGCYCFVEKPEQGVDYYYTKLLDERCFAMGGVKMLYSSIFLTEAGFDDIYNGGAYKALKKKYDPEARALSLYQKVAQKR